MPDPVTPCARRVGDASQTGGLSAEFNLTLNASLAPYSGVYPVRRGPAPPLPALLA